MTNAYAAKRALFDRLTDMASRPGGPLGGVQVTYSWPASAQADCVYGGGVTFDQIADAVDGPRSLVREEATIGVHIRVHRSPPPPDREVSTDERCEEIGLAIAAELTSHPRLAGGNSVTRIASGQADYLPDVDAATSMLSYRVTVVSYFDPLNP